MASPHIVTVIDPGDPRVADFRQLNDAEHRRRVESSGPFRRGQFVAEGWLVLERLLRSRYEPQAILVASDRLDRLAALVGDRSVPTFVAEQSVVDEIVGFPLHRGVVATADRGLAPFADAVIRRSRRLVILEGINDAENLGAILRSARALGGDGVLLDSTCADPLSRRSVRVSMGHALSLEMARFTWDDHAAMLRAAGFTICAMSPGAVATDIDTVELPESSKVAVMLGAEGPGLSERAIDAADLVVRIPLADGVDSLNVAAAAAIALQRLF